MIEQHRTWLFRAGQLAMLGAMAVLGLFDLATGMLRDGSIVIGLARLGLTLATAAVWLPAYRQGSVRLPLLGLALAAGSLLVTAGLIHAGDRSGSWGLSELLGMLLVLFTVAWHGRAALAIPATVLGGLALTAQPLRSGLARESLVVSLLQTLAAVGAGAAGTYLRSLVTGRERMLATVRAEQRAEFARDLHDFVAHHVTGIVVQAQGARFIAEQDPQRVIKALEQIERAGAQTMAAMRRMVGVLRQDGGDAPLTPLAGIADLAPLIDSFQAAGGPPVRLHVDGPLDGVPVDVSTSAYRVVMEALTNVRQHAEAVTEVTVWITRRPGWLLARVTDDGRPATGRGPSGFGLSGLRERVGAIGGRLHAGPDIEKGWIVDAALPLAGEGER